MLTEDTAEVIFRAEADHSADGGDRMVAVFKMLNGNVDADRI